MKALEEIRKDPRVLVQTKGMDGGCGWVNVGKGLASAPFVIWSNGGGWDHVSVSYPKRCTTWEEMCKIKEVFFLPDECCVEFHPAAEDYVNFHQYCLHIWRPQNVAIPKPPKIYV